MIRRGDQVRLSVQKLGLRKKRAAFSVISVALGVVVVVAVNSLIANLRDLMVKTTFTEEIDRDVIRIFATENPYEYSPPGKDKPAKPQKRYQFLTESLFEEMRGWPEVEAADRPVQVREVSFDALANRPRNVAQALGVPEVMMRRYAQRSGVTNAIPLIVGERSVRLAYNTKTKKFDVASTNDVQAWLGREVTITLGDRFAQIDRFNYDDTKKQWEEVPAEDLAQQREALQRSQRGRYDPTIYSATLLLKGRVVGFCPGNQVLLPQDTAVLCEKWLTQRRELAAVQPGTQTAPDEYEVRGRRTPKPGEFAEGLVLVKRGANAEAVAGKIREMGFQAVTRASAFEAMVKELDTIVRFIKRIAFGFGAVLLGLAVGLLWSTTSRIVSDSRVDIGLFRALGATKRDIRRLFLSEAVLLGWLGTVVGMLAGWTLAWFISRWTIRLVRRETVDPEQMLAIPDSVFSVDVRFCLLLLAGAAVVSILAGLWPANRAANVDPVKALRRE